MDALTQMRGRALAGRPAPWGGASLGGITALVEANPLSSHGRTKPTPPAVYAQLIQDTTELSPEARRDLHATRRTHRHPHTSQSHNPPPPGSNEAFREQNPRPEDRFTQEELMMIREIERALPEMTQANPEVAAYMQANLDRIGSEKGMGLGVQQGMV